MVRQFRKAPLPVCASIAVLAIGIGGASAAFSALYAVVLRPLPYPNPDQLVVVHSRFPRLQMDGLGVSPLDYLDLRQDKHLFSDAGAFFFLDLSRTGIAHAEKVNAIAVTASMFKTLGAHPQLGRYFTPVEERMGGPHVVILSHTYWQSAFGSDPNALGKTIRLNGEPYSIIGVMPRSFAFPNAVTQMWVPAVFKQAWLGHLGRQNVFLRMYARLADGVTFDEAARKLEIISRQAAIRNRGEYTVDLTGWKYFIAPLSKDGKSTLRSWTWVLFLSVVVLFVIVCVNVGGLLVLRSTQKAFEVSVRLALGAGILQAAKQSMLEAVAICLTGGIAGAFTAIVAVRLLSLSAQFGELHASVEVFAFGAVLTLLAAAFCSAYPIWRTARADPADAISAGGRQKTDSRDKQRTRRVLVVIQIAASTALLAVGGLLLHSYARLLATPLGFDPNHVMTMQISLPPLHYASASSRRMFYQAVVDRIRRMPGISEASACTVLPFGYGENVQPFSVAGAPAGAAQQLAVVNSVLPHYFNTLRIPLLAGRYLDRDDAPGREYAAVIDRNLADRYFPAQNAVGRQLQMGQRRASIVGVVGTIKEAGLDVSDVPMLYLSALQDPSTDMTIVVRAPGAMKRVPGLVQSIVTEIDRDQPVYDIASLQSRIDASLSTRRFVAFLLASFSVLGIVITAIGLYGTLSYSVLVRGREFGIRSALGATPRDLAVLVFRSGMHLVFAGVVCGGAAAIFAARYLSSEFYGIQLADPMTWSWVGVALFATGVIACLIPSWRASCTDTASKLKEE